MCVPTYHRSSSRRRQGRCLLEGRRWMLYVGCKPVSLPRFLLLQILHFICALRPLLSYLHKIFSSLKCWLCCLSASVQCLGILPLFDVQHCILYNKREAQQYMHCTPVDCIFKQQQLCYLGNTKFGLPFEVQAESVVVCCIVCCIV